MNTKRATVTAVVIAVLTALSGCGGDDGKSTPKASAASPSETIELPKLATRLCFPGVAGCPNTTVNQKWQEPPNPRVPAPDPPEVTGGGGGGDPEAAARIQAQIPDQPGVNQIDSVSPVLNYAIKLSSADPALKATFSAVQFSVDCAARYGVVGARAYVDIAELFAGVVVVFSQSGLQNLADTLVECVKDKIADVMGGGETDPTSPFSPCLRKITYESTTLDGVTDRYYVFVLATATPECDYLEGTYSHLSPTPF